MKQFYELGIGDRVYSVSKSLVFGTVVSTTKTSYRVEIDGGTVVIVSYKGIERNYERFWCYCEPGEQEKQEELNRRYLERKELERQKVQEDREQRAKAAREANPSLTYSPINKVGDKDIYMTQFKGRNNQEVVCFFIVRSAYAFVTGEKVMHLSIVLTDTSYEGSFGATSISYDGDSITEALYSLIEGYF